MAGRMSQEEIRRRIAQIPGYESDDDGRGFKMDTPAGKLWTRNVLPSDEIFESEFYGTLNVSEMYRRIGSDVTGDWKLLLAPLVANVALRDINIRHAKSLSPDRLRRPIIVAFASEGVQVLDGSHRIFRLNKLRKKTVSAVVATSDLLRVSRVKKRLMGRDGNWLAADSLSDERFESEVLAGERLAAKMLMPGGSLKGG